MVNAAVCKTARCCTWVELSDGGSSGLFAKMCLNSHGTCNRIATGVLDLQREGL